jgi:uncharacterized protein YsxB (DUF464 family)
MINVVYNKRKNSVIVTGHANSAPVGHDLVCAAVSALALTLAGNVSYLEAQEVVKNVTIVLDEGNAEIQCKPNRQHKDFVKQIYHTICVGFELLATKYPQNISYEVVGEGVEKATIKGL